MKTKEAEIKFICHKHGEQEIVAVGFSEIFLKCGCAWKLIMGKLSKTREKPSPPKRKKEEKPKTKKVATKKTAKKKTGGKKGGKAKKK